MTLNRLDELVGLDLGANSLKAVTISAGRRSNVVKGALRLPLPHGVDWDDISPDDPLIKEMRGILATVGMKGKPACFALPTLRGYQRWMDMEGMPREEWSEAAGHRMRKTLPEDREFYVCVDDEADPINGEHLVTALPKDLVNHYGEIVQKLGFHAFSAELESNAVLRIGGSVLRRKSPLLRDGAAMIADIGLHRTRIDIIKDERIEFTREFRFGSSALTDIIAKELVLSPHEASIALETWGSRLSSRGWLYIPTPSGMAQIEVTEALEVLVRESRRIIRYFRSIYPERSYSGTVASALLTGGLAGLNGLSEYFEHALTLETGLVDPLSVVRVELPEDQFVHLARTPYVFTVATGLALAIRKLQPKEVKRGQQRVQAVAA